MKKGLKWLLLGATALTFGCSKNNYESRDMALRPTENVPHEIIEFHKADTIKDKVVTMQYGLYNKVPYVFVRTDNMKGRYETFLDYDEKEDLDSYRIWSDESAFVPVSDFGKDEITPEMQSEFDFYLRYYSLKD